MYSNDNEEFFDRKPISTEHPLLCFNPLGIVETRCRIVEGWKVFKGEENISIEKNRKILVSME